jgi:hypothetical protein
VTVSLKPAYEGWHAPGVAGNKGLADSVETLAIKNATDRLNVDVVALPCRAEARSQEQPPTLALRGRRAQPRTEVHNEGLGEQVGQHPLVQLGHRRSDCVESLVLAVRA